MGYPLHGQDLSLDITPVQARLGWAVGWAKPEFWGRAALLAEKEAGPRRLLWGLESLDRGIPRPHMTVRRDGDRRRRGHQRHVLADPEGRHRAGPARHRADRAVSVSRSGELGPGAEVEVDVRAAVAHAGDQAAVRDALGPLGRMQGHLVSAWRAKGHPPDARRLTPGRAPPGSRRPRRRPRSSCSTAQSTTAAVSTTTGRPARTFGWYTASAALVARIRYGSRHDVTYAHRYSVPWSLGRAYLTSSFSRRSSAPGLEPAPDVGQAGPRGGDRPVHGRAGLGVADLHRR